MRKITTILTLILTFSLFFAGFASAQEEDNRTWWSNLSPEWKNLFLQRFMKAKQLEQDAEISDGKLKIIVGLTKLDISNNQEIKSLEPLAKLKDLEKLVASNTGLIDLKGLSNVPKLTELDLSDSESIEDLSPLKNMGLLKKLNLYNTSVADLSPLTTLRLKELNVGLTFVQDNSLEAIKNMDDLETLVLKENHGLMDLIDFSNLTNLRDLDVSHCPSVSTDAVESLSTLPTIENLNIANTGIKGLLPLIQNRENKVNTLLTVDISNTEVKQISALYASTELRLLRAMEMEISGREEAELRAAIKEFKKRRPTCIVEFSTK